MNKKYINVTLIIIIFFLIIMTFINNIIIQTSIIESTTIFINKVFPFLFIMMIFNNLLIALNFPYYLAKKLKNPFIYIFIMSILSGCPVNAILIKNFLDNKVFDEKDAQRAICFTTINNPLFIYSYLNLIFNNLFTIIKLMVLIYLSNFIILLYFLHKYHCKEYLVFKNKDKLTNLIINSITKTLPTLLNIFTIITFFKLICDLMLPNNYSISILLKGIIEITQGLNLLINYSISTQIKELLIVVILSFSGLSIHIQLSSILHEYNINYKYFYISRIFLIIFNALILSLTFVLK